MNYDISAPVSTTLGFLTNPFQLGLKKTWLSLLTSFHHRSQVVDFFTNYKTSLNLKQQSVLADAQFEEIHALLITLGIMFYVLTGPYWILVQSKMEYLDFYRPITHINEKLKEFAEDPSRLLDRDCISFIPNYDITKDIFLSHCSRPLIKLLRRIGT